MIFIKKFVTTTTYSQRLLSFDEKVHLLRFERYLDIFLRSGLVPKKTRPHPALLLYLPRFGVKGAKRKAKARIAVKRLSVRVLRKWYYSSYVRSNVTETDDIQFDR